MTKRSRLGVTRSAAATAAILLIAAGCTGGAGGSATPTPGASALVPASLPAASAAATTGIEGTALEVLDFTLEPLELAVDGPDVALDVTNAGPTVHNVAIRDDAGSVLGTTRDLREGEAETLAVTLPGGSYVLFCSLPGHESLGIKGTLTVTAP